MPSSPNSPRNRQSGFGQVQFTGSRAPGTTFQGMDGNTYVYGENGQYSLVEQQQPDSGPSSYYQAPEPQVDPTTTPAYLAYMNALTAEGDMIGTNDREQRTQAAMRYGTKKSDIAEYDPNAAEDFKGSELTSLDNRYDASGGINDRTRASFESRGALNSGAYANRVTQNREQRESATAAITKALQDAITNIGTQSAAKRADIERRKAGAALGMID